MVDIKGRGVRGGFGEVIPSRRAVKASSIGVFGEGEEPERRGEGVIPIYQREEEEKDKNGGIADKKLCGHCATRVSHQN